MANKDDEGDDLPRLFTPLVSRPGEELPDWLFGPAGKAGLPAPLSLPQGVNVAVGIDIIEVDRVRQVFERHGERFLRRVFTEIEILQCRGRKAMLVTPPPPPKVTRLAGRFAAKEAISKALGTGLHGVAWREMEIVQVRSGRPTVRLHGRAKQRADLLGISAFDVSIADLAQFSVAIAVAVQTDRP
ncbi:MAG: holo-ACP synthase [Chloroflexota bacterium]|nr:holo-ACP synthase [Chloroflexota bacterium]